MANSNNIKNSINFYTKPTLTLKKSTSNLWLISVLVIGKVEQLPAWKIKNQSQNIKYKNWNLLHSDKLAKNIYFYQADIECTLSDVKSVVDFSIAYNNEEYTSSINLPAIGQMPNTTYSSCHGFSSASIANKFKDKKNTMLDRLLEVATKNAKFELCLMGGDQIYSDEIFSVSNEFKEWSEKSSDEQVGAKFTKTMHNKAKECYLNCYMRNWCNPSFNQIISTMPAIMMWDDHDIIDGWGSYDEGLQNSAMHQNLYQIAELYFCIFQQYHL